MLLPGADALLAPAWVPWSERLKPGDLGVGDLLPTRADDVRLQPGYASTGEDADELALWELGLGRTRVLSPIGRDDAVDRWYSGDHGPTAPIAEAAPAACATCGFLTLMAGTLRQIFGVCTNEYSPSDGRVVSFDHGCGAHSEVAVIPGAGRRRPGHRRDRLRPDRAAPAGAPARLGRRRCSRRGPGPLLTVSTDPFGTASVRERVLAAWAASPARFREDANAEEDLALGGYRDRVVVELAQNASDAARRAGVPGRLLLRLQDGVLTASNTGAASRRGRRRVALDAARVSQTRGP